MSIEPPEDPWGDYTFSQDPPPPDSPRKMKFAFYGRCSTEDNQDPETSLAWQLRASRQLIEPHGGEVVAEFFDIGLSRSLPWKRRPEAQRLLTELTESSRKFDAIVVGEGQRCWYGSQFNEVAPVIDHYGISLWVPELGGEYDPKNSSHYMLMTLTGGMSRGERQRVQERVKQGMAAQVEAHGRWQGGRPPYGYIATPYAPHPNPRKATDGAQLKRLELDPVAAPVVKDLFGYLLAGKGIREIARLLNSQGILCPSAHDPKRNPHRKKDGWQANTVSGILKNPRYTGFEFWGKFKKTEELISTDDVALGYSTRFVRSKERLIRSRTQTHPSIVSIADYKTAQSILETKSKRGRNSSKVKRTYMFQSIIFCGVCGRRLEVGRTPSNKVRYRCRGMREIQGKREANLHPAVQLNEEEIAYGIANWVRKLFSPENLVTTVDSLLDGDEEEDPMKTAQKDRAASDLLDAERRLKNFIDAISEGIRSQPVRDGLKQAERDIRKATVILESLTELKANSKTERQEIEELVQSFAATVDVLFDINSETDSAEINRFYHSIGLITIFDQERDEILLEIQPKMNLTSVGGDLGEIHSVRGRTLTITPKLTLSARVPLKRSA